MIKADLLDLLSTYEDNQEIDFIVSDTNDNYEATFHINEFDGEDSPIIVEITLQLDEDLIVTNKD